ncbi:calcium-binding protein [Afifella marina]|uniref:Hemolysin-type calcium-binding repeat-containing protein n=1 Tax=Afifella marina DSM 2698 TaxID=1120955 RepID=A0A1G5NWK9_AFIMA|nr:calcium-binding protein [Afifella marina]MBK1624046.1 hypothetical protein [Afifella marina DSM 2698]MBK1627603.1 hypothetical protein [Afifella marina]MBK5916327.1 hypothetical protein [Afifella marina]RAI20892.1 hypothetical protein CH311_08110 [Afifella marina DSM 2698]SCZ41249.1 Hemolysin-type calcium-binding repeat-containing protein [Afifella marina DSM 2698]
MAATITVYDDNNQVVGETYTSLEAAVKVCSDGYRIELGEGTVSTEDSGDTNGQLTIDVDITITGAGAGKTFIVPRADTGSNGDGRAMILVKEGTSVDISDVTVDGEKHQVYEAIRTHGDLDVTDSAFEEIHYSTYLGTAVAARGADAVLDVSDSTFTNIGRIGAYYGEEATGTFDSNTYTGKGDVDGLDYGVEVESGAVASITDNSFAKVTGVASTDQSGSAAILITTYFGDGSEATITGNSFEGFSLGVAVGYLDDDTSKVTFGNGNTFTAVGEAGVKIVGNGEIQNISAISGDGATVDWAAGEDANVLSGSSLSDTLSGGAGDDNLTGGSGDDVALFGGNRDDYTITQNKDGSYTVTDTNDGDGNDGADKLTGIEGLQFGNDKITYELDANSPNYAHSKTVFQEDFQDSKATDSFLVNGDTSTGVISVAYSDGDSYGLFSEAPDGSTAFTKLGGYSSDFGDGYSVSAKIYLDTEWADGEGFDVSVAANGKDGAHQRDFIFHVTQDEDTGKLLVGADNNSSSEPKDNLELHNHATIATSGWYTFDWNFYENDAGNLEVAMNVYDDDGDFVFSEVRSSDQDSIDTEVGGNRYFWFTDISVNGGIQVDDVTMTVPTTGGGTGGGGGDDGDIGGGSTGGEEDDTLEGTDNADTMSGGGGNDEIEGGGGNDTLFSGEGNDTVDGGDGDDMVFGGVGDDVVTGGAGNDQAYGGTGNDDIDGGDGDDFLGGGEGNDTIVGGSGNDLLFGGRPGLGADANDAFYAGDGDDQGFAGDGNDLATGGDGTDEIGGGSGNDTVGGGNGNDLLYGGAGDDVLYGGADADTIYGGSGNDQIYFGDNDGAADIYASVADNGTDVVFGFENGTDHLDVRANGFTSFADLTIGEDGEGNATIDLGDGNILTLNGVAASELDASDFLF